MSDGGFCHYCRKTSCICATRKQVLLDEARKVEVRASARNGRKSAEYYELQKLAQQLKELAEER